LVLLEPINPDELSHNICEDHIVSVPPHELVVGIEVLNFELQQLGRGLLLIEQV
jgi:hypothetical protein